MAAYPWEREWTVEAEAEAPKPWEQSWEVEDVAPPEQQAANDEGPSIWDKTIDSAKALGAGAVQGAYGLLEGAARIPDAVERWGAAAGNSIDRATGDSIPSWGNPGRWIEGAGHALATGDFLPEKFQGGFNQLADTLKGFNEEFLPQHSETFKRLGEKGQLADKAVNDALEGNFSTLGQVLTDPEAWAGFIGNAAPSLAVSIASGGSLTVMGIMEGLQASTSAAEFEKRTGQKVSPEEFVAAQAQMATVGGLLEKAGLDNIMGGKGGFWRKVFGGGLGEAGTELGQQANSNVATKTFIDENQSLSEGLLSSAMGGFGSGAGAAGLHHVAGGQAPLERRPAPTERDIISQAREDARRIIEGGSIDVAETPPPMILNEAGLGAVQGGDTAANDPAALRYDAADQAGQEMPGNFDTAYDSIYDPATQSMRLVIRGDARDAAAALPAPAINPAETDGEVSAPSRGLLGTQIQSKSTAPIDIEKDDAVTILAKAGGLNRADLGGEIDPAHHNTRIGIKSLFRANGAGLSLDGAAEYLRQYGFDTAGPNEVVSIVRNWLAGNKTWSKHATKPYEQQAEVRGDDLQMQQEAEERARQAEREQNPDDPFAGAARIDEGDIDFGRPAATVGRDGQVDAFGRNETAQSIADATRAKDEARNGAGAAPALVQGGDELFANGGQLEPELFDQPAPTSTPQDTPQEPRKLPASKTAQLDESIRIWTRDGAWEPDEASLKAFKRGFNDGWKDGGFRGYKDPNEHPDYYLGRDQGEQSRKYSKSARAAQPAEQATSETGKTRLDVSTLNQSQLVDLARSAGIPEARLERIDLESRRKTVVSMLQELEDKGLLDSSVLSSSKHPESGAPAPTEKQTADQVRAELYQAQSDLRALETRAGAEAEEQLRREYPNLVKQMHQKRVVARRKQLTEEALKPRQGQTDKLNRKIEHLKARLANLEPKKEAQGYTGPDRRKNLAERQRVEHMSPDEMRRELLTDHLTGLGNKRAYDEGDRLPVQVSIDADSLKWINDNAGHPAGDELLRAIGHTLEAAAGLESGQVRAYHVSGDEFIVEAESADLADSVMQTANNLLGRAELTFELPDGSRIVKKGVGISHGTGSTLEEAEVALRAEKARREGTGERAGRGQEPPGTHRQPAPGEQAGGRETSTDPAPKTVHLTGYSEDVGFVSYAGDLDENAQDTTEDDEFDYEADQAETEAILAKFPRILPYREQLGQAAKNVGKLINDLHLEIAALQGEDSHFVVKNDGYEDLVIEVQPYHKGGKALYLTHYYEKNGDKVLDAEMVFRINDGKLTLVETAVEDPFRGGEHRGKDAKFANLFSKNLLQQGFGKFDEVTIEGENAPKNAAARAAAKDEEKKADKGKLIPKRAEDGSVKWTAEPVSDPIATDKPPVKPTASRQADKRAADYGKKNTLFTEDAAEKAREILRKKLGQLNAGLDPELMQAGMTLAGYHIEAGARKFADFARAMTADLGDTIKPYLRSLYEAVRHWPGLETEGMSSQKEVEATNLDRLDDTDELADNPFAARVLERLRAGDMPQSGAELRQWQEEGGWYDKNSPRAAAQLKEGQEAFELALGVYAAEVAQSTENTREAFDKLVELYNRQPALHIRSSTSVANQAYSTPIPLGYAGGISAGLAQGKSVWEPTAGNGLLLVAAGGPANAGMTRVNELEDVRAANLRAAGYQVTQRDATEPGLVPAKSVDVVIANPPFGHLKDADGKNTEQRIDGYTIRKLDHVIAARALEAMKDDGQATLILGADMVAGQRGTYDGIFFNWLYSHYNVAGHYEVDGKLYSNQGAKWPVVVLTIKGRKAQADNSIAPPAGTIARFTTWEEVSDEAHRLAALDGATAPADAADRQAGARNEAAAEPGGLQDGTVPEGGRAADQGDRGAGSGLRGNVTRGGAAGRADRAGRAGELGQRRDVQRADDADPGVDRLEQGDGRPAAADQGRNGTAERGDVQRGAREPVEATENQYQVPYIGKSAAGTDGTLVPRNMRDQLVDALGELEDQVGGVDQFLMEELGYDSLDELHDALMGLQVDSVAAAIHQMKNRQRGVVIADQTGVGKGRQAAALMRWAMRNGRLPIFVTVKNTLFSDIFRDLTDIGEVDPGLFMFNADATITDMHGQTHYDMKAGQRRKVVADLAAGKALPEEFKSVLLTYSQVNKDNNQRRALLNLVKNSQAILILDESHNAAGDSSTGEYMRNLAGEAAGVTYLSATYAKRPDNMPLYHRTDLIDAVDDMQQLIDATERGGLRLQTVIANLLTRAGQFFRRERSYDGVSMKTKTIEGRTEEHEDMADSVTEGLRAIIEADRMFHNSQVKMMDKAAKDASRAVSGTGSNKTSAGVSHNSFTSVVHNFIRQFMLGVKADVAADEAIAALERGQKPVVAVENTMGSFLQEYVEENGLSNGDPLGSYDWRRVLKRALRRSRRVTVRDEKGNKTQEEVPLEDLLPEVRWAYEEAEQLIDELALADIPVSPIDWIRNRLEADGRTVKEITGREWRVKYDGPRPVLGKIDPEDKDKTVIINAFNRGEVDALVINVAGSTGISLHASEKFKDQRQRHMIVAQPALDIAIFMQMLGRIHRTGQVVLPEYTILNVDLPAEVRPTAVLNKKMKSLNANTSSNTESATSVEALDIINHYGDQVVADYLRDEAGQDIAKALGFDLGDSDQVPTDLAMKVTGKISVMPVVVQRQFYAEIERRYGELIEFLDRTGQNELHTDTLDLQAEQIRSATLVDAKVPGSVFGGEARLGRYSVRKLGKPPTAAEVQEEINKTLAGKDAYEFGSNLYESKLDQFNEYGASIDKTLAEAEQALENATTDKQKEKATLRVQKAQQRRDAAEELQDLAQTSLLERYKIGSIVPIEINEDAGYAVVVGQEIKKAEAGNPYAPSRVVLHLMVNSGIHSIKVNLTRMEALRRPGGGWGLSYEDVFDKKASQNAREEVYIVTGNLVSAYSEVTKSGRVINFTTAEGRTEQGILMPKSFDPSKHVKKDATVRDADTALEFLTTYADHLDVSRFGIAARDNSIRVLPRAGRGLRIQVAKSKKAGGKWFLDKGLTAITGDFYSRGSMMVVDVEPGNALAALKYIIKQNALYAPASTAELIPGRKSGGAADLGRGGQQSIAAEPEPADDFGAIETKTEDDAPPAATAQEAIERAGLEVVQFNDPIRKTTEWHVKGKGTYDNRELLRRLGGRWRGFAKAWGYDSDPTEIVAQELGWRPLDGQAASDVKYRATSVVSGRARGLGAQQAQAIADRFRESYNGPAKLKVRVFGTQAQAFGPRRAVNDTIKGGFDDKTNSVLLIAENLADEKDAWATLRHEVLGHYGLTLFKPETRQKILQAIHASRDANPFMRRIYQQVREAYPDERDDLVLAEEVFARIAERQPGKAEQWWAKIVQMVAQALRQVGLVKGLVSVSELRLLVEDIGSAIKRGQPSRGPGGGKRQSEGTTSNQPGAGEGMKHSRRKPTGDPVLDEAYQLAGLAGKESLADRVRRYLAGGLSQIRADLAGLGDAFKTGAFDKFHQIKVLERAFLGGLPAEQSGYVAARLSTGLSSVMRGILLYGAPEWRDGIIQRKASSKGLLEVLEPVKGDLEDWLMWMIGKRAERLMSEGRENLFQPQHIQKMLALANGRVDRFQDAADGFAEFKRAILDLAEGAGLIDGTTRPAWDLADWIPFYRVMEEEAGVKGPRGNRGLSGQSSGIRTLRGGDSVLNDPLENIVMNFAHLVDASLKNHAIRTVKENFDGLGIFKGLAPHERMAKALIPLSEVKRHLTENGVPTNGIPRQALEGIARMWSFQAPTGKDVVRIMEDGKAQYYHVRDAELLKALTAVDEAHIGGIMKPLRFFKRLLTGAVTADPAFIARNFTRDMLHAWTINRDGFRLGIDSARGLLKTINETGGGVDMLFAGASFMGGYLNANDPGEVTRSIRRALREKGLAAATINKHLATVIDSPARLWEAYRHVGDAVENASREAVYEAAVKKGKSKAEAVFEARDLMDYSMRGQWVAVKILTDMVPFMNARLQGLYKLGRSGALPGRQMVPRLVAKGGLIALASILLMLINRDDDRYEELEDWDKDTYWHFWVGDQHFRLPKPFEIGLLYGTLPERIFRFAAGQDDGGKFLARVLTNTGQTLNLDPTPQAIKPAIEVYANRNAFTGRRIESMSDEGKLPSARYNESTSETMRAVGEKISDSTGLSPKQLEHLVRGYFGTIGTYLLGVSDLVVRKAQGQPALPELRMDEVPVISSFARGSGPARSTVYQTEFYELLREADQVYRTARAYMQQGRQDDADRLVEENDEQLAGRKFLGKTSKAMSAIRKEMDEVYRDRALSPAEKRAKLDELAAERNRLAKEAVTTVREAADR